MKMRILITGASGFIGGHLARALSRQGHAVIACARDPQRIGAQLPDLETVAADFANDLDVSDWLPRLAGVDIVINAVGIIHESRRQSFAALHRDAPCALFQACAESGIRKVFQISALGADEAAVSRYHLSKRAADDYLSGLDLNWVILRPSIVYGPGARSMSFFKALAALPLTPLVGHGDQPAQPIHIDDLVGAVMRLLGPDSPASLRIDAVGPEPITMIAMLEKLRRWLRLKPARPLRLPYSFSLFIGRLGGLLRNMLVTEETIGMLQRGNTADVAPFVRVLGFRPATLDEILAAAPATQSDLWYARLYFLAPLLRLSIAVLWIASGIISAFVYPRALSDALLAAVGITGLAAPLALYGAATLDFVLGVATLTGYRLRLVGLTQIALIIAYSIVISAGMPELWMHPFGPLTKNIPLIAATFVMIATQAER